MSGTLDGAMPAAIGFVGRLVQVPAFCSGWTPKMGSFGNLVSVRSFSSRLGNDAERGQSQDTTTILGPKWELVYYQWKKPEITSD